jgi:hypothetical protein
LQADPNAKYLKNLLQHYEEKLNDFNN